MSRSEKALSFLRTLPRITLDNIENLPGAHKSKKRGRGQHGGKTHGIKQGGMKGHMNWPKLGWESGNTPIQHKVSHEKSYNYGIHAERQYPTLSLQKVQLLIDTGRLDAKKPVDLAALCNTKVLPLDPNNYHFGFNLTSEGLDNFKAKLNIEVQWACEQSIAAIERNGGVITTAYYDIACVWALRNPKLFFQNGHPIPRRLTPPANAIEFYTNPANRGYLADPRLVAEERLVLAQKYGYDLPDLESDPDRDMLLERKDPRQVFYGLEPGWVVNLRDKVIYKPQEKEVQEYYKA